MLAEPRPIERVRPVSLPMAVAAATGGFLLGVACFLLVRVLRRPRAAQSLRLGGGPRARPARRGGRLALVPGRHPPAQGPIAAALEVDVAPVGAYRLPTAGRDGVLCRQGGALVRVVYAEGDAAVVRAWVAGGAVRFRAEAPSRAAALAGVERMRFALGTDHDLREFHRRFRRDPLVGPVIRRRPWLRPRRRPEPFEALAWAVCEQLIEGAPRRLDRAQHRAPARLAHGLRHAAVAAVGRAGGRLRARPSWTPAAWRRSARSRWCARRARSPRAAPT